MKSFAVAAGKGGVGKSTIAVQLALACKRLGQRVALLDADLYGPSIPYLLPQDEPPKRVGETLFPAYASGIATLSLNHFRKDAAVRAPIANQLITQMFHNVNWGDPDTFLIDFPPGTGDIHLTICQQIRLNGAVLVTMPNELALLDVRKSAAVFQKMGVPIVGVIENMSFLTHAPAISPFGTGAGRRLAHELGVPLWAEVPLDSDLAQPGFYLPLFDDVARHLIEEEKEGLKLELKEGQLYLEGDEIDCQKLQKQCPCALCVQGGAALPNVEVKRMSLVGHYGFRFVFSSGCSNGIYEKELLESCVKSVV